ncbi:terminase small subunit [Bradyrhizobium sp. 153]|uniref:terminase small subunit n=1 Tax=Bradyrhizobium sp. 153 TaxID=2782627 RepID=UPI001FF97C33|nr:terminase small subunit [Bradyrhizobium sp. 153]MCK1668632.1 terminase small subunit [Bradyrhizobium sp. 153]
MSDTADEFEFEPDDAAPIAQPSRGMLVNKSELAKFCGLAPMTLDKLFADGAPFVSKGSRKIGWKINTAEFFGWYVARKVHEATGDEDSGSFDIAKTRDKEAQARLRELQIAEKESTLIPVDEVVAYVGDMLGVVRSRFLAVESQVIGLTPEQKDAMKVAIADAFADVSGDKREDWTDDEPSSDDDSEAEAPDDFESLAAPDGAEGSSED